MYKDIIWYKEIVGKIKLRFINFLKIEDDVYILRVDRIFIM